MTANHHCRHFIVTESTGCADHQLSEDIYAYFAEKEAWAVAPRAVAALTRLRDASEQLFIADNAAVRYSLAAVGHPIQNMLRMLSPLPNCLSLLGRCEVGGGVQF